MYRSSQTLVQSGLKPPAEWTGSPSLPECPTEFTVAVMLSLLSLFAAFAEAGGVVGEVRL